MGTKDRRKLWEARYGAGLCVYCGKQQYVEDKKGCEVCLNKKSEKSCNDAKKDPLKAAQYRLRIKSEVINKYGGKCACCQEDELLFLTIDHINNDGNRDRKDNDILSAGSFYLMLRKSEIRKDLQVLCFNCNSGKQVNGGICPHVHKNKILLPIIDGRRKSVFGVGQKIEWPPDDELVKLCNELSCERAAKQLGVHGTAIRGRLKRRGLYDKVSKFTGKYKRRE